MSYTARTDRRRKRPKTAQPAPTSGRTKSSKCSESGSLDVVHQLECDTFFSTSGLQLAQRLWDAMVPVVEDMERDGFKMSESESFIHRVTMSLLTRELRPLNIAAQIRQARAFRRRVESCSRKRSTRTTGGKSSK